MKKIFKLTYPALFIFSTIVFIGHYIVAGQAVYGDGIGYYAHLHSWIFDGDWNNTNEFKHLYSPENNNSVNPIYSGNIQDPNVINQEKRKNHFGPGMAFLLLPFYILAHAISKGGELVGITFYTNGYSDIYQIVTGMGAIAYSIFGLWLLECLINKFVKDRFISRISSVSLFLTTNLFYYGSYNVITSHFSAFILVTAFFYVLACFHDNNRKAFLLGLISGLATANRQQDGFLVVIWLVYLLNQYGFKYVTKYALRLIKNLATFSMGFVTTVSLFLVHLHSNYESISGLSDNAYVQVFIKTFNGSKEVKILGSLIDSMNGLFIKSPVLIPVFIYYFYLLYKKKGNFYYNLVFLFFLGQYVIITLEGGWAAAAYGGRMYISSFVFFGLILSELAKVVSKRYSNKLLMIIFSGFILFNFYSIVRFTLYEKQATLGRVGIEEYTQKRINRFLEKYK